MNRMHLAFSFVTFAASAAEPAIKVSRSDDFVSIETDKLSAKIVIKGYVSGIAKGSLRDKTTGAVDLGFGLHIMDFLLAPGWADDEYGRDVKLHGNLPKHFVEGPQICTQAKKLDPEIIEGPDFVAVRLKWTFTHAAKGLKAGSVWEQTLVFRNGVRWVLTGERITSANTVDKLFYRIDMPGHIRHKQGDTFSHVHLSYHGTVEASEFKDDFAPDAKFLFQRKTERPERFIRAYRVKLDGKPGPWLAGITLEPSLVYEAWCHQRGYVCFIQELGGRSVRAGETFGAAYIVGWFDDVAEMEKTADEHKGITEVRAEAGRVRTVGLK